MVPRAHKMNALARVLDMEQPSATIVFCRTRTEVDELTETLIGRGLRAEALHGGLSQDQRDRVMQKFRLRKTDVLVATDVAARGLDVKHVSHVVNFDVPVDAESYVHRIGRTGRAGRDGVAITFAEPREHRLLRNIERLTALRIEVGTVPTVADLRERRFELLRASLREAVLAGDFERHHGVVESLAEEFDVMDVAAAALRLLDARQDDAAEADIPAPTARTVDRPIERASKRSLAPKRTRGAERETPHPSRRQYQVATTRLWIGAGRKDKLRPGDLVGALANEGGIDASVIGAIQIADNYATVDVPEGMADEVLAVLKRTKVKGLKLRARRDAR
jgi:ATP-dependent RNA helicase DeaD